MTTCIGKKYSFLFVRKFHMKSFRLFHSDISEIFLRNMCSKWNVIYIVCNLFLSLKRGALKVHKQLNWSCPKRSYIQIIELINYARVLFLGQNECLDDQMIRSLMKICARNNTILVVPPFHDHHRCWEYRMNSYLQELTPISRRLKNSFLVRIPRSYFST